MSKIINIKIMTEKLNRSTSDSSIESKLNDRRIKENELIDRALERDESAYSEIIRLYKGKVAATVYSILGRDYVEEISHEAFIRAFNSIRNYRRDSSFYTYLIRITVNLCRDEIRRKQIKRIFNFTEVFNKSDDNDAQEQIQTGTSSDPINIYDAGETINIVREEMQNLPSILRVAVTLREIDELSYNEIAKLLNISVGTAKTRVFRARQILRDKLTERLSYGK
ncbi:MAG: RNA polymerase sigma factor [Bacteroidetes bacterium]|nr:RNA polymerase sigma factor [Bacteroidota bacterium]MCL5737607.1 RNA polymerase sigma factor [Bacteroidota bacterium]